MNEINYKSILESLLFVWPNPIPVEKLASCLEVPTRTIREYMDELIDEYEYRDSGVKIIKLENTYQMCADIKNNIYIEKLLGKAGERGLSKATLEVLAIVAYKQPVTKGEVESIRGTAPDKAFQTLMERGLIEERGKADRIGYPTLYGTTKEFLKTFNISNLKELPIIESKESEE